jgi:predicted amidohydrolase
VASGELSYAGRVRVTILELAASWNASLHVLDDVAARIATGPATDLVLLPEASLHGYVSPELDFDLAPFGEPLDGPTARRCAAIAADARVHLVAPLVLREATATYNAMACFDPRGELAFVYRKRYPWVPETWATPGPLPAPIVDIAGRSVTIAICYDLHFLGDELAPADVLLFPSAWVEQPDLRAARLTQLARRYELYVANANWAPGVVRVPGQGGSCAIGPDGTVLARASLCGRIDLDV